MTRRLRPAGADQALMGQINATSDQKAVLEIQARIGAENALLAHEMSQVQMLQGMADSEERIARSRDRERQYEMLEPQRQDRRLPALSEAERECRPRHDPVHAAVDAGRPTEREPAFDANRAWELDRAADA